MALAAHLYLESEKQGKLQGSCDITGSEGAILVYEFSHIIGIPNDPQSGLPSGPRIHEPFRLVKLVDRSSPLLYQALNTGEHFTKWQLHCHGISKTGLSEHQYSYELEQAFIVRIAPRMPNSLSAQSEQYPHIEEVSFIYRKITWRWEPEGIQSEDGWKSPT